MTTTSKRWADADEGEAFKLVFENASDIQQNQSEIYELFVKLDCFYDPSRWAHYGLTAKHPSFNLVATSVDAVFANIVNIPIRTRIIPDNAAWSEQRQARQLQYYVDDLSITLGAHESARRGVFSAGLKGRGFVKVAPDLWDKIQVENIAPDDIIVDNRKVRNCKARELIQRRFFDVEELKAKFPDHEDDIDAHKGTTDRLSNYQECSDDEIQAYESWSLPFGEEGKDGYKVGRHVLCIEGADLIDEEYTKDHFPFASFIWSEGNGDNFFGIGGSERIVPHQSRLNRIDYFTGVQMQNKAAPTTYVDVADFGAVKKVSIQKNGQFIGITGRDPRTVDHQAVSSEQLTYRARIIQEGQDEFGVSRMMTAGIVPGGLESGVAVREARQTATGRFAIQEADFETFCLDISFLILEACQDLGDKAPEVKHVSTQGARNKLQWSKVKMAVVRSQMSAASSIARTAAGRTQFAIDLAQAGVVSQDESRRLMDMPDVGRSLSLHTAALESMERQIEEVLDGAQVLPTPYSPLKMGIWRFTAAMHLAENDGAPEDAIERLRAWITRAIWMLDRKEKKDAAAAMPPPTSLPAEMPTGGNLPTATAMGPDPSQAIDPSLMPAI